MLCWLLTAAALATTACGQTGPLTLPGDPVPDGEASPSSAATTPSGASDRATDEDGAEDEDEANARARGASDR
jgi:predicted small lipoprotein YifL